MSHREALLIQTEESKQCKVTASTAEHLGIISLAVGQLTFNATMMTHVNWVHISTQVWVHLNTFLHVTTHPWVNDIKFSGEMWWHSILRFSVHVEGNILWGSNGMNHRVRPRTWDYINLKINSGTKEPCDHLTIGPDQTQFNAKKKKKPREKVPHSQVVVTCEQTFMQMQFS